MTFPAPVPEIPAANVDKAAAYYVNTLGLGASSKSTAEHAQGGRNESSSLRSSVVAKDRGRVKPERTPDGRIARGVCDDPDDERHRDQDCWVRRNHTEDDASN
jgi:hypothetical protein